VSDVLKVTTVKIKSLTPDPQNARQHDERNIEAIKQSLQQFGQRKPIVVARANDGSLVVIAGNGTLEAATALGWSDIAVAEVPSDWDADKARAFALADNRTAELANWNDVQLASTLLELDAVGYSMATLGFTPTEMGVFDVEEVEPPALSDGPKSDFQQITFTLHSTQADVVLQAIAAIKLNTKIESDVNANVNANAIYEICKGYLSGL
jgi:ParB-like chromosome segregation protein Spo0J